MLARETRVVRRVAGIRRRRRWIRLHTAGSGPPPLDLAGEDGGAGIGSGRPTGNVRRRRGAATRMAAAGRRATRQRPRSLRGGGGSSFPTKLGRLARSAAAETGQWAARGGHRSRLAAALLARGQRAARRPWRRVVVATTDAAAVRTSPACEGQRRSVGDGARVAGWWDGCVWRRCTARVGFGERSGRATTPRRASVGLHAGSEPPAR